MKIFPSHPLRLRALNFVVIMAFFAWLPGGDPLNPQTGVRGYVEIGLLLLAFLVALLWWGRRITFLLFHFWWLLLPGAWAFLSTLWSLDPVLTAGKAAVYFLTLFLAILIAWQRTLSLEEWLSSFRDALLLAVLMGFALNVLYYGTPLYFSYTEESQLARRRLSLAFEHPLVVGHMFALMILVSAFLVRIQVGWRRMLSLSFLIFAVIGLLLTNARASIGAVLLAFAWEGLLYLRKKLRIWGFVLGILFFLSFSLPLLGVLVSTEQPEEWLLSYAPDYQTLNGRIPLWVDILHLLGEEPFLLWLGTGFAASRFVTFNLAFWNPGHTHNSFLEILASLGGVGLLLFLPTLIFVLKMVFRLGPASFAIYLVFMAFFNPIFQGSIVFFAILTVLLVSLRGSKKGGNLNAPSQTPHLLPTAGR